MESPGKSSPMAPEPTRLRQIALVAEDLQRARHLLTTILGTEVIYEDPAVEQWGLKNILVPLGGDIIEVVSPFRPSTAASRHLSRHGDSGYMIIMQSASAIARRDYLISSHQAKVIFTHNLGDSVCIQYHPKGIKGGVIPELDSHFPKHGVLDGVKQRFAPWHACGPSSTWRSYAEVMRRYGHLHLLGVSLQLAPGDQDLEGAAKQWESIFGMKRLGYGEVGFTNASMRFMIGQQGESEGLKEIVVGVEGTEKLKTILERAKKEGLEVDEGDGGKGGQFSMLGVSWRFLLLNGNDVSSKL